jgi:diguanylate cyclase (GGDEF)-like protein
MPELTGPQRRLVRDGAVRVAHEIQRISDQVQAAVGQFSIVPQPLTVITGQLTFLQEQVGESDDNQTIAVSDALSGLIRTIITVERRRVAQDLEQYRQGISSHELVTWLEQQLKPFDVLASRQWFVDAKPARLPRLADFLTLRRIETNFPSPTLGPRLPDDKFQILQASSQIHVDLAVYRLQCAIRNSSVGLVFLDIDDFKAFNTNYTEPVIDRDVLPVFMRIVERCVFGHGFGYRYGGDELVLLLPNVSSDVALAHLDRLRTELNDADYPGIDLKTRVSMGLCIMGPECPLTDRELLQKASWAKKYAKKNGKNAVAGYATDLFRDEDLVLLRGRD